MKMAQCPRCFISLDGLEDLQCCPNCGARLAAQRRRRFSPELIALMIILVVSAGYVAVTLLLPSISWARVYPSHRYSVTYRVTGTASSADITYRSASGITETQVQRTEGHTFDSQPWEHELDLHYGQFIYVSAQRVGDRGTVKCEILLDGQVVAQGASRGTYTFATCGGSAGK